MLKSFCTSLGRWTAIVAAFIGLHNLAEAQFVAFNDQAPGPGTSSNATTWSVRTNFGVLLPLKDVNSGNTIGVSLRLETNKVNLAGSAGNPSPGTPAYVAFNGFVDFAGSGDSSVEVAGPTSAVTNIFVGVSASKAYSLKATAVRAGSSDYSNRWTLVTLLGAASFTTAHTANTITSINDPTLGPNQVAINTGLNTVGDMADFETIVPAGTNIMLVSMQYSNTTVISPAGFHCNGIKGYAITGFRLEEKLIDPNSVAILNPTNNSTFVQGEIVTLSVASGSAVSSVSFYDGAVLLGTDNSAPFGFVYNNVALGSHNLTAVGSTGSGSVTSAPIHIQVIANQAPSISVTNPVSGAKFMAGNYTMVNVDAEDPDDGVAKVDFYIDGLFFYSETVAPYFVQYNDMPVGTHTIVAVAVDNSGLAKTSAPVNIVVTNVVDSSILISNRSVWKYLDTGIDQGDVWRASSFNDSTWKSGPAELGFGDAIKDVANGTPKPEQTVIAGGPSNARIPTLYFRRIFYISDPSAVTNLIVNLLRDDGGVVYINGREIFRSNMPDISIVPLETMAFTNLANAASTEDGTTYFSTNIFYPDFLVQGANTIAVEVHQNSATSSDISFDLMLFAQPFMPLGGILNATAAPENPSLINVTWTGTGILQETTDPSSPVNWHDVSPQPVANSYTVNTAGGPQKFFRLR
jgi:Bacterial Ig domain